MDGFAIDRLTISPDGSVDVQLGSPSFDVLAAEVTRRKAHLDRITAMYYGSGELAGEFLDGADDQVEPFDDRAAVQTSDRHSADACAQVGAGERVSENLNGLHHLLLLRTELIESRLDLIEATLGISHGGSLIEDKPSSQSPQKTGPREGSPLSAQASPEGGGVDSRGATPNCCSRCWIETSPLVATRKGPMCPGCLVVEYPVERAS